MDESYIPLDILSSFLGFSSVDELIENKNRLVQLAEIKFSEGKILEIGEKIFPPDGILNFIRRIQGEEAIVFFQWVKSSKTLENLLLRQKLDTNDFPIGQYGEHFLLNRFKKFISLFLRPVLLAFLEEDDLETQLKVAGYIPLLDSESAMAVENKLEEIQKRKWEQLKNRFSDIGTEKELVELTSTYFSDQKIKLLNHLTKEFYHIKIDFVEQALELFKHPSLSNRMAFWIIGNLNRLNLNSEHKEKIREIHASLKNNDGVYFKHQKKVSGHWGFKQVLLFVLSAIVLTSIVYFVFNHENTPGKERQTSSFQFFSKKERLEIDSLIRSMERKTKAEDPFLDTGNSYLHLAPIFMPIQNRNPLLNETVENFIQDNLKVQRLISEGKPDSCKIHDEKQLEFLKFPNFKNVVKSSGNKKIHFKNESSYQIIVVSFENLKGGSSYIHVLPPKKELKFDAGTNQHFLFIPGKNLGKIHFGDKNYPIKDYRHHFCFTDQNYENQLLTPYLLKDIPQKTLKILFNENSRKEFYFLDLYEGLGEVR